MHEVKNCTNVLKYVGLQYVHIHAFRETMNVYIFNREMLYYVVHFAA